MLKPTGHQESPEEDFENLPKLHVFFSHLHTDVYVDVWHTV